MIGNVTSDDAAGADGGDPFATHTLELFQSVAHLMKLQAEMTEAVNTKTCLIVQLVNGLRDDVESLRLDLHDLDDETAKRRQLDDLHTRLDAIEERIG